MTINSIFAKEIICTMKILVVDDEQDICEILQFNLEMEGYEVTTANSAEEALELPLSTFDIILLDVMMGDVSGFQLAKEIKANKKTSDIPIIFITALEDEEHTVKGLDIGADDYMKKPLSIKEVKARIKAVLRRSAFKREQAEEHPMRLDYHGISVNTESKTCTIDGVPVQLTKLEFELIVLFLSNPDKVFSRDELLCRCWPSDTYVLDRTVDVNITRLRKKIGKYGKQIKTRFGYGYTFDSQIVQE